MNITKIIKMLMTIFFSFFILLFIGGCSKNIIPEMDFYEKGASVVVMWEAPSEHALSYDTEHGGLLGALIGVAIKDKVHQYVEELENIKISPIANKHYLQPYGKVLETKGMNVNLVKLPVDPKKLREKKKQAKKKAPYDFTHLREEKNIDYVMFLDINQFGIERQTGFGMSFAKPNRKTSFVLYLVDTQDNGIIGRYRFHKMDNKISKEWKENNYEQYKNDVAQLLMDGLQEAYFGFFEE